MDKLATRKWILISPVLGLSLPGLAQATELEASLGVTGFWMQSHVVGEDDPKELWPYISLSYGALRFNSNGLGFQQQLNQDNTVGAFIRLRRSPVDVDDNSMLRDLRDRKDAAELALNWSTQFATMDISTTLAGDISDRHEGYEANIKVGKPYQTSAGMFIPALSLAYLSEDLVNYYYGVNPQESLDSGFTTFQGNDALVSRAELTHVFPLGDHWQAITNVSYSYFGSGITDSPIVDRSDVWGGRLTVAYKF